MKQDITTENKYKLYKLYKYIIYYSKSDISAYTHYYFPKTNKITKIYHPASIDKENNVLVIDQFFYRGMDTDYTFDTFNILISKLPEWNKTTYFQIKNGVNSNLCNTYKCLCSSLLEIDRK